MHFGLKLKTLAMIDLDVTLLIHLRFFQRPFHPPPFLAAKRPFTAARVFPFHCTNCADGLWELERSPRGFGRSPAAKPFYDFMVWSFPPLAAKRPHLRLGILGSAY